MLHYLQHCSLTEALLFFWITNIAVFLGSVLLCWLLGIIFHQRRIFDQWQPLHKIEMVAAASAIVLNAIISVIGWYLWHKGFIDIKNRGMGRSIVDCLLMIMVMDFGMYIFHRLAHVPLIYRLIHRFHHRHETTNPVSLFVLHPLEVLGFGSLMLVFLLVYPMSLYGLMGYLALNILFGTLGHSGVEPFPRILKKIPGLRNIGTSTFHAEHHEHPHYNFGFYTLIWDRIFGTLDPDYERRFDGESSP